MQLLRKIAFPISLIYALVVHVRNFLFDIGIFKGKSFGTMTICVGNLSVGGTGKTPMIEHLLEILGDSFKMAVLSRGYKRKSKGYILATTGTTVEELGDEPFQMYTKFPEIAIAVDADRCNGIKNLENDIKPDIILLDDAFQHRKVKPGFSILLTAFGDLYPNDRYLPTGNLRDGKKEAKRADIIVVTKCPEKLTKNERDKIYETLRPKGHQRLLFSYIGYEEELKGVDRIPLNELVGVAVTLVTGIADPGPLVNYLKEKGLRFEHLRYRDHHFFSTSEIGLFNTKEIVLTTEKDYARLKDKVKNLYYIPIRHRFFDNGSGILKKAIIDLMP